MAENKRTEIEILKDKAFISEMLLEGRGATHIAHTLNRRRSYNLSESQIRYDIGKIKDEWITTYLTNYDSWRAQELARIDRLEREYWEAWMRSRRNKKKVVSSENSLEGTGNYDGSQDADSRSETVERTPGDRKFLEGIQWCIEQRCKILGLDAAKEVKITWQEKARQLGIDDPGKMKENLVQEFMQYASKGLQKE